MDFTVKSYRQYLALIKAKYPNILRFDEIIGVQPASSFCLIRHDVDRKPINALRMAQVESAMGIRSTYYFRAKPNTFKPDIFKAVYDLGHEIGYHYENLSDTNGNIEKSLADFEKNLNFFRKIVPIKTISMHGRPLKPFDNRDLWRDPTRHKLLKDKFSLLGEVYLDIDYSDIAYINDTGRNWTSTASNLRDKVNSNIPANFNSQKELLNYLEASPHPKMVFQIHPERWTDNPLEWSLQCLQDTAINCAKAFFTKFRKSR